MDFLKAVIGDHLKWQPDYQTFAACVGMGGGKNFTVETLVVYEDVVLSADRAVAEKPADAADDQRKVQWSVSAAGGQAPVGELIAFSAETGERLWSCPAKECYNSPIDVLVADGLVWTGQLVRAVEPGVTEGRDPKTGEVRRTRPNDQEFFAPGMFHGRCYRNKATCKYLVLGRSGVEFIDGSIMKVNMSCSPA